jgi:hypothetical protein
VAPFQAVPTPVPAPGEFDAAAGRPDDTPGPDVVRDPVRSWSDAWTVAAAPPEAEPSREPGRRTAGPREAAPGYGDWTSPSRTRDEQPPATEAIPDRNAVRSSGGAGRAPAPATEAIPDRHAAGSLPADAWSADGDERSDRAGDGFAETDGYRRTDRGDRTDGSLRELDDDRARDDSGPDDATGPATGPSTGVVGGRAAFRAERQAAEAERRRTGRRTGGSTAASRFLEDEGPPRTSGVRRAAAGLLAVAVIALLVLGVYSFTAPETQEASGSPTTEPTAPTSTSVAAPSTVLPPLDVEPLPPADGAVAAPVRVPVTVLNATGITGLAAEVAAAIGEQGWQSPGVGQYQGSDVAATTVYYTDGDETQRQAALQLIQQFPQIRGPGVRFFEVPGVADPGLVLVTTGEWRP